MARGYGILLVILGHFYIFKISSWIYSFHMPLFFLLAGYVFKSNDKLPNYLVKKANGLIKPYCFLSVLVIIYRGIESLILGKSINILKETVLFVIQRRHTTLWFITCLFIVELLYYFVDKIENKWIRHCIAVFITLIGLTYETFIGKALFWNIDIAFAAFGFFYVGVLLKKYNFFDRINQKLSLLQKIIAVVVLFGVNFVGAVINNKVSGSGLEMMNSQYGFWPLTYFVALVGLTAVIIFAMLFSNRFIMYIGKNTWIYFGLHQAVLLSVLSLVYKKLGIFQNIQSSAIESVEYAVVTMLIILVISTILNELIIRTKLKWFLNK